MIATIMIGLLLLVILIGVILVSIVVKKKKQGTYEEPNYRVFFILGICFLPMGIIFVMTINPGFIAFIGLGAVYIAIGLSHKDQWKTK